MGKTRSAKREQQFEKTILFAVICNINRQVAWKSKKASDGNILSDKFMAGIKTSNGHYAMLCDISDWALFDTKEINNAPEIDDTGKRAIYRLFDLANASKF